MHRGLGRAAALIKLGLAPVGAMNPLVEELLRRQTEEAEYVPPEPLPMGMDLAGLQHLIQQKLQGLKDTPAALGSINLDSFHRLNPGAKPPAESKGKKKKK